MTFQPKLTPEQRTTIANSTDSAKDAAAAFNISTQTVYDIRQDARNEARRMEREANSRSRNGTIRDLSEWDDSTYEPESVLSRLDIPAHLIPEGIEYQWCTVEVNSQPFPHRVTFFEKQGWRPVPAERHDGFWMPKGSTGGIIVDGLQLMERPKAWCERAREISRREAKGVMDAKRRQIAGGDIPGVSFDTQHPSARRVSGVRSQYEAIPVPEE